MRSPSKSGHNSQCSSRKSSQVLNENQYRKPLHIHSFINKLRSNQSNYPNYQNNQTLPNSIHSSPAKLSQSQIDEITVLIQELKSLLELQNNEKEQLTSINNILKIKIQEQESIILSLQSQLTIKRPKSQQKIETKSNQIIKYIEMHDSQDHLAKIHTLQQELEQKQIQISNLSKSMNCQKSLKNELIEKEQTIIQMQNTIESYTLKIDEYKVLIDNQDSTINQLHKSNQILQLKVQELLQTISVEKKTIEIYKQSISSFQQVNNKMKQELVDKETMVKLNKNMSQKYNEACMMIEDLSSELMRNERELCLCGYKIKKVDNIQNELVKQIEQIESAKFNEVNSLDEFLKQQLVFNGEFLDKLLTQINNI